MFERLQDQFQQKITIIKNHPLAQRLAEMRGDWRRLINWLGHKFSHCGISANLATVIGFAIGLLAINFLAMQMYLTALVCILLNRFFDAVDGAIARCSTQTDFGIFLDATLDYIFYAGVIFGFALAYPANNAVAACFLLFGFTCAACAMLAYAVVAFKNRSRKPGEAEQLPFYLGGIAQGGETLLAVILLCIVPQWFLPVAVILGCWCVVKALTMVSAAYFQLVIAPKGKGR